MRNGWVALSLGELTENTRPICYGVLKPGPQVEGGVPLVKITDMDRRILGPEGMQQISNELDNEFRRSRLRGGEVLLSIQGTVGRVAIAALTLKDANISRTIAVIDPDDRLHNLYLMYVLEKIATDGDFDSAGSTRESLNISTIRNMKILCPPIPEQKRIVDLISSVDSYIEVLQQHLKSAKRSRNAVLHELLTAVGEGWIETSLGEIADVIGGGTPSTTIGEYWDGDIVWLTPTEITSQDGKVVSDSIRKITDLGFKNSGAQMLPMDSVILTSRASVGFVALAGKELCTNQGFQSLIPKPSVLSKFLMFWIQLNRPEFESRSAGSTFKEISKSNVKSIKLELPPLPEQKRIVEIINTIDEVISQTELTTSKAQNLRSGLLSDLLSGEHEIPASYDKVMGAA